MLNFQPPPDPGEAVRNRWQGSIDDIFNAYQRAKAIKEQRRSQDIQDLMNYGFQTRQLTPENFQNVQAANQAQQTPMMSQDMLGHGPLNLPSDATRTSGLNPMEQALNSYLQKKKQMETMTMEGQKSKLGLEQAQTQKALGEARWYNERPTTGSGFNIPLTNEEMGALVKATQRKVKPLPTSLIQSRGPRAKVMAQALIENHDYVPNTAEIELATGKRASATEAGTRMGTLATIKPMAETLEDTMGFIRPLVKKLAPAQIQLLNSAYQRGLEAVNDQDVNALLTHLNEATALYASVLKGGRASPTDQQFQDAKKIFRRGLSPGAFEGVANAVHKVAASRVKHLQEPSSGALSTPVQSPEGAPKPADAIDALIDKHLGGM